METVHKQVFEEHKEQRRENGIGLMRREKGGGQTRKKCMHVKRMKES